MRSLGSQCCSFHTVCCSITTYRPRPSPQFRAGIEFELFYPLRNEEVSLSLDEIQMPCDRCRSWGIGWPVHLGMFRQGFPMKTVPLILQSFPTGRLRVVIFPANLWIRRSAAIFRHLIRSNRNSSTESAT